MIPLFLQSQGQGWFFLGLVALAGCAPVQFPTLTIYETPHAFVRLEAKSMSGQSAAHSHPADISAERMAAVLRGIIVQEPLTRLPLYDNLSIPRRHRAFDDEAVSFWAPLLSLAFSKATPEEIVTFYQSRQLSGVKREVTSGGIFLQGGDLHFFLSNYRSDTHSTADTGVANTHDDRLTPMRALAVQTGTLHFEPSEFQRPTEPQGVWRLLSRDRRELIIRIDRLPVTPLSNEQSLVR